jgi:mannose-6-phosphate isomerase-like protein (cupin superfamily)
MTIVFEYMHETERLTPELCFITEIMNSPAAEDCSISLARVAPRVTTRLHRIFCTAERYVILEGYGMVEIDGAPPHAVKRWDVVNIAPGVPQRITNVASNDLIFLCICTPRFRTENYVDLEDQ